MDALAVSEKLGGSKPHPFPLSPCAAVLGIKTSEAMYVGDQPFADVYGTGFLQKYIEESMENKYYLGIDQGTTGSTAILFNEKFIAISRGYHETPRYFPAPGLVEHKAEEVLESVKAAVSAALNFADAVPSDIVCIGIDHEGESALMWDAESGKAVSPVILWQDRRTAPTAKQLDLSHGELIRDITALPSDCYFSATKWQWILQNISQAKLCRQNRTLMAGNLDAWLLWNLTGGKVFATDASTASRTQLFDIKKGNWSKELIDLYGLSGVKFPEIRDTAADFGTSDPNAFLGIKAPITALMCDQQAALLGQGCTESGMLKTTYGTGCFMLMNTGDTPVVSDSGLLPTVAWQLDGKRSYALDGGIYIAGAATQWLRDGLGLIRTPAETGILAQSVADNGGLYFVPAFSGLSAPHRDPTATGMMIGITGGVTKAHIARATLESTAYQVCDLLNAMERETGAPITLMRCDGGACANEFLMQFQSDIAGIPLEVPAQKDTTALGAAFAAALSMGLADLSVLKSLHTDCRRYEPHMNADERAMLLARWKDAVERCRGWNEA